MFRPVRLFRLRRPGSRVPLLSRGEPGVQLSHTLGKAKLAGGWRQIDSPNVPLYETLSSGDIVHQLIQREERERERERWSPSAAFLCHFFGGGEGDRMEDRMWW